MLSIDRHAVKMVLILCALAGLAFSGCAGNRMVRVVETTGYCGCSECCGWERGSWTYLKMDFWNRYVAHGPRKGKPYTGKTADGKKTRVPHPGLFSWDSIKKPWMIPVRIIFFPWLLLPQDGTIAADTDYYPFGTRMYVPGYGWGVVEDRGAAIKGSNRIDLFFRFHGQALCWGKQKVKVEIK